MEIKLTKKVEDTLKTLPTYLEKEEYKTHKMFCKDPECELCKKYQDVPLN